MDARHPTTKPVKRSWLLALFCLYTTISNLNTSSIMPFSSRKRVLVWKGSSMLSNTKDMAGIKPALSMSLWSDIILLRSKASESKSATEMNLPNMLLDASRKERNADNALKTAEAPEGIAAFAIDSLVIPGKKASKTSSSRARGLLFLKIPITLLDQNSSFAKQI